MNKDYFSTQAQAYNTFRPHYPDALFDYLRADLDRPAVILDCATGNGQAAVGLSSDQIMVVGTDLSFNQLNNAPNVDTIDWVQATVEQLPLKSQSVDLITIAQALHWFEFESFYAEAHRVLKPRGLIAAWTYSLLAVCPKFGQPIEEVIRWFYKDIVGEYWPPERRWVDDEYRSIPFPFNELKPPRFAIEISWNRDTLLGYISSWSAVQLYQAAVGKNPIPELESRLSDVWSDPDQNLSFSWPLSLRIGYNN